MTILSNINNFSGVNYFEELPFYNKPIECLLNLLNLFKCLKNIDLLTEQLFYEQLSIIKTNQAFSGYAMPYKVEIVERKYSHYQLEASKLSIKDLFGDLLNEMRGFKYQITVKVLLKNISTMETLNFFLFILIH